MFWLFTGGKRLKKVEEAVGLDEENPGKGPKKGIKHRVEDLEANVAVLKAAMAKVGVK
jgi:hypothetical protein